MEGYIKISITLCGDIVLGGELSGYMGTATLAEWVTGVCETWRNTDLLIGNLEGPCVRQAQPVLDKLPELVLYSSAKRVSELAAAGFGALTIGNNHIMDCGPLGLQETIQGLEGAGIYHAGAGMTLEEALKPAFIHVRGVTIGLVSFCYGPPARRSTPGVAPCRPNLMRRALRRARADADLVIAALHDGLEYSDVPPKETRERLRLLAANGADIVVGHHPHVLQGLEWYSGVPIACSLGNFVATDSLPHVAEANFARMAMGLYAPQEIRRDGDKFRRGALLTCHISDRRKTVEWHPFRQAVNARPELSSGEERIEDLRRLGELSSALLNPKDPRHELADAVLRTAFRHSLSSLDVQTVLKLALKPKWRYVPTGIQWLLQRISCL